MKQTLDEFILEQKALLDTFATSWLVNNNVEPDAWPMSNNSGEWDEQFSAFHK